MKLLLRFFLALACFSCSKDDSFDDLCSLPETSPCANSVVPPDISNLTSITSQKYDVFVVMGQSNTLFGFGYDSLLDKSHPRIFQLGRGDNDLKVIEAKEPLDNHEIYSNHIGFALTFSKWYASQYLVSDRNILIIPCGEGGTGFGDHRWNKGDDLYNDAVARTNHVLTQFPGSELKAILWHQGEDDVGNENFQVELDSMIVNFRRELQTFTTTPFILGGMVPYWSDQSYARQYQECILKTTPDRITLTAFADPRLPCRIAKPDDADDEIHYDAKGERLLGFRYFEAYRLFQP